MRWLLPGPKAFKLLLAVAIELSDHDLGVGSQAFAAARASQAPFDVPDPSASGLVMDWIRRAAASMWTIGPHGYATAADVDIASALLAADTGSTLMSGIVSVAEYQIRETCYVYGTLNPRVETQHEQYLVLKAGPWRDKLSSAHGGVVVD
ncbi:hypothetical protein B7463_g7194, partial [Scytalidium lignicola]